ncbi:hypothetical protein HET69_40005 [Streptomyces sp. CJ_13]|uniref:hypothetical protein n=1 Tax=Streptomyces sp. CJ_13 TaxID=2724943 RepID=UPI001BDC522A|nr:hypothetical protein [Streptomyces sp. CJ_13]MBT1189999.1 hypothetical protein [Streptomyces sp. CJ_13]
MSDDLRPRTVQHRRCQPLHTVYGFAARFAGCVLLLEQPVMWLFVVPLVVLVVQTRRLARHRACAALRRRDEREAAPARVHWVWGASAAGLDAALVAGALAASVVLLLGQGDALVLRGRAADYLALGAGAALAGAHALTHRMSAQAPKAPQPEA